MSEAINIEMTEDQLATIISGLLFSCSVNVVSDTNKEYQKKLYELAKLLRTVKPNIQLPNIQFVEEANYEDEITSQIKKDFEGNIELVEMIEV